jgi:hypothetical protein
VIASQTVPSALLGHLFPFAFLLLGGVLGIFVTRYRKSWSRRSLFYTASGALGLIGAVGLGFAIWPSIAGIPAAIIASDGIARAPWQDAVAWKDVIAIETASQKMGSGWTATGAWLQLKPSTTPAALRRDSASPLAEWIWRADPVATLDPPFAEPRRYCNLSGLNRPAPELVRAVQDAWDRSRGY